MCRKNCTAKILKRLNTTFVVTHHCAELNEKWSKKGADSTSDESSQALAGDAQWIEQQPVNQKVAVQFPVRAHAWVVGQVPHWKQARGNQLMFLSPSDVSLPFFLPPFSYS